MPYFTSFAISQCLILQVFWVLNALFYIFLAATSYRKIVEMANDKHK